MPQRIPVNKIIVHRDGKRFAPPLGKPFDFTAAELEDIKAVNPGAVRKVINESADAKDAKDAKDDKTETKQEVVTASDSHEGKTAAATTRTATTAKPAATSAAKNTGSAEL